MEKVRVLHLIATLGRGGAERQLVDIVQNTARESFEHIVCYLRPPDAFATELRASGHNVVGLDLRRDHDFVFGALKLARLITDARPHVLHGWLFDAHVISRLIKVRFPRLPLVASLQCPDYDPETIAQAGWPKKNVEAMRWIDLATAKAARPLFVACSDFVARSSGEKLHVPSESMRVIYNSFDSRTLASESGARARVRGELGLGEDDVVFTNVGRLDPQKGQEVLIRAFAQIATEAPKAKLVIVGKGPLREALLALAHSLGVGDRVVLTGVRGDVGAVLDASDVFVFPSLFEGFGIALVEAMSRELPCITSRTGPLPEIITDGEDGLLCAPGSVEELARAMKTLYPASALRKRLAVRARERAHAFSSEAVVPAWEMLYRELSSCV